MYFQRLRARYFIVLPVPSHTLYTRLLFVPSSYRFNPVFADLALETSVSRYFLLPVYTPCHKNHMNHNPEFDVFTQLLTKGVVL